MIRDFRLLLRHLPADGQLALPFDAIDAITDVITRRLSGSVWGSSSHPPFHLVSFGSYLDHETVRRALEEALAVHRFAWVLRHENRQDLHDWSAAESLEWFRLFKTGTEER